MGMKKPYHSTRYMIVLLCYDETLMFSSKRDALIQMFTHIGNATGAKAGVVLPPEGGATQQVKGVRQQIPIFLIIT